MCSSVSLTILSFDILVQKDGWDGLVGGRETKKEGIPDGDTPIKGDLNENVEIDDDDDEKIGDLDVDEISFEEFR